MKRAVLIGINYYGTKSELGGCINDICDVRDMLQTKNYTHITILRDYPEGAEDTPCDPPTSANIIRALKTSVAATSVGDTLYVHYSGHGSYMKDVSGDEPDGRDECICPVDMAAAGMISDDTLHKILVRGLPASAKLRAVFDSCHSGSVLDLQFMWRDKSKFWQAGNVAARGKNVVMLSGCTDTQTSADAQWAGRGNGALTHCYLAALSDAGRWKDLCAAVRARMADGGFDQYPCLSVCELADINQLVDV